MSLIPDHTPRPRARRRYHFGSPGGVYIFVTLLIALGAFNSQNNLLFWAFGFSLAIFAVSGVLSGTMLMGLDVRRAGTSDTHAGELARVRYEVSHRGRAVPAFALTIEEAAPAALRPKKRLLWWRNKGARPLPPLVEPPVAFVAHVGPGESVIAESVTPSSRRGVMPLQGIVVHSAFPFGLIRKSLLFESKGEICIFPELASLQADLLAAIDSLGDADHTGRVRGRGQSDDFHSLREYNPGDSPRSIAWKPSARRGVLLVRQSLAPAPNRLWIVLRLRIDATNHAAADEQAISIAAAAAQKAHTAGLAVGLCVPLTNLSIPPRGDVGQTRRILTALARIDLGAVDRRGQKSTFPAAATSGRAHCICIHAGGVDTNFGPADRCTHIGVESGGKPQAASSTSARPSSPIPRKVQARAAP